MSQDGMGGCSVAPCVHAEMPKKDWTFRIHLDADNCKPHEVWVGFAKKTDFADSVFLYCEDGDLMVDNKLIGP